MATDKTEVPTGTIIGITVLVLGTLVSVQYSITSYFHSMYGEEQQRKVLGVESTRLAQARAADQTRLANIATGMQQVATALGSGVRPESITPRVSTDLQSLQGWGQRPRLVPNPPPARGDLPAGADTTRPAPSPAAAPAPAANAPAANAPAANTAAALPAAPVPAAAAAPTHAGGAAPAGAH